MSRIHDALKKAELEKTVTAVGKQMGAPAESEAAPPSGKQDDAKALALLSPALAPPAGKNVPDLIRHEEVWSKFAKHTWTPDLNQIVFGNSDPFVPGVEQFRTLRSRLYRVRENQPLQTLLISSAIPGEGKTLIAANLAQAFVRQHGCRVLLIDADLRAARLHSVLGAPLSPGLADFLQNNETSEFAVIQRGYEGDLCFIPGGKPTTNPSELISSGRLKELFKRVKPLFDWIIIDSPPALPVADSSILAGEADGVLLVVRGGVTPLEVSQRAIREFRDTQIIGVVLNTVKQGTEYISYYTHERKDQKRKLALS